MAPPEFTTTEQLQRHYMEVRARLNPAPPRRQIATRAAPAPVEPKAPAPVEPIGFFIIPGQRGGTTLIDILKRQPPAFTKTLKVSQIIAEIGGRYGFTPEEICSTQRGARLVLARHIAMYIAKTLTSKSLPELGRLFGGRDHTTVLHAVQKMTRLVAAEVCIAQEMEELLGLFRANAGAVSTK